MIGGHRVNGWWKSLGVGVGWDWGGEGVDEMTCLMLGL